MTQCAISLSLADQFKYNESYAREIICDSATNENGKEDFDKKEMHKNDSLRSISDLSMKYALIDCECEDKSNTTCDSGSWSQRCSKCKDENKIGKCEGKG